MQICRTNGFYLKLKKCDLLRDRVNLLGHSVGTTGILPQRGKLQALQKMRAPQDFKELRSLLGLLSFHRRFVPAFSDEVELMNAHKTLPFIWEDHHEAAFQELNS